MVRTGVFFKKKQTKKNNRRLVLLLWLLIWPLAEDIKTNCAPLPQCVWPLPLLQFPLQRPYNLLRGVIKDENIIL